MNADGTSGGDPSSDDSWCQCDGDWFGGGDFVATAGINCLTHTIVIRALWSVAVLVAAATWLIAWYTVIVSCRKFIRSAHKDSDLAAGGGVRPGGPQVMSQNNTMSGSLAPDSPSHTHAADSHSPYAVLTCDCGEGFIANLQKSWASVPTRFALFAAVTGPCVFALGITKLVRMEMVGTDTLATVFGSVGLLFFWLSAFNGLHGFVKLHLVVLQVSVRLCVSCVVCCGLLVW